MQFHFCSGWLFFIPSLPPEFHTIFNLQIEMFVEYWHSFGETHKMRATSATAENKCKITH